MDPRSSRPQSNMHSSASGVRDGSSNKRLRRARSSQEPVLPVKRRRPRDGVKEIIPDAMRSKDSVLQHHSALLVNC